MIFSLNTILYFFNVDERLAASFVELARSVSCVSHLRFFCLHRIACLNILTVTQA